MSALPIHFEMVVGTGADQISGILRAARRYLAMDVGFVSEFTRGDRVVRYTDADGANPLAVGAADPLEDTFCHHVMQGLLPVAIPDARKNKIAKNLPAMMALSGGAHLSVPLRHADGTAFGSFSCFSFKPKRPLSKEHLGVLKMCADVVSAVLAQDWRAAAAFAQRRTRIGRVIEQDALEIAYQPLYRVEDGRLTGFEALARFPHDHERPVNAWFAEASEMGYGLDLEFLAVAKALEVLPNLDPSLKVTINLSPAAIASPRFDAALAGVPVDRVVVELTEHAVVDCYASLRKALEAPRRQGLRLAIDDVGAGHATFLHILELAPDLIKLDRSLIHGLHRDRARRALAEAITMYGRRIGCEIVAEGVEDEEDLQEVRTLGITRVQGYLLGRPMPSAQALRLPPIRA